MPVVEAHELLPEDEKHCLGVLVETALLLRDPEAPTYLIGGWAAYVLTEVFVSRLREPPLRHRGSVDVDVAWASDGLGPLQATRIVDRLRTAGFENPEGFRWTRAGAHGGADKVDLMVVPPAGHPPEVVTIGDHTFGPFWNGDAALRSPVLVRVRAVVRGGEMATADVRVAGPAGILAAKMQAVFAHDQPEDVQQKHLYDVFALARTFPGGPEALAVRLRDELLPDELQLLIDELAVTFAERHDPGPRLVAQVRASDGGDREQPVTEVWVTVNGLLRELRQAV